MVQPSHLYMTTGKTIALTIWTFVSKVMSLLFNMLSRFIIAFLPRSKHLLILWLQSPSALSSSWVISFYNKLNLVKKLLLWVPWPVLANLRNPRRGRQDSPGCSEQLRSTSDLLDWRPSLKWRLGEGLEEEEGKDPHWFAEAEVMSDNTLISNCFWLNIKYSQ